MSEDEAIPNSYEQWRYCIETLGGIELTPTYVKSRLAILQDFSNAESQKFAKLYGKAHLQRTNEWFRRAASELP